MPYTHTSLADLNTDLANRLGDSGKVFWIKAELDEYLKEALYTFAALTLFWRERSSSITLSNGTAFYSIPAQLGSGLMDYTLLERDLIKVIQYHFLENASSQTTWNGTDQFTLNGVSEAIQRRRNEFLLLTSLVITQSTASISPPVNRIALDDDTIDVRRVVYEDPSSNFYTLWREDENALTAYDTGWSRNAGIPRAYSVSAVPPVTIQIAPTPNDTGTYHIQSVSSGAMLNPATGVALGIPDNLAWVVKWGAIADLLSGSGQSPDPLRSKYAQSMWELGIQVARQYPMVMHGQLDGKDIIPDSLHSLDAYAPGWEGLTTGTPNTIAVTGDLVGVYPVPDSNPHSMILDVVRNAPVGNANIQIGQDQLNAILCYAEHLAMFKCAGEEFLNSTDGSKHFLSMAVEEASHLKAESRTIKDMIDRLEYRARPAREEVATGA